MLWEKISKFIKTHSHIFYSLLFVVAFLFTRVPSLSTDAINPDGVNWHYRTQQFVNGLKYFQFEKTYQHYHPGVTLMWVTGVPIALVAHFTNQPVYTHLNFALFHFTAKYALICVQLLLSVGVIYLLARLLDFKKSFIIVSIFTFEPFFVGNSRLYHLDVLLTLFIFSALLIAFNYIKSGYRWGWVVLTGLFCALSFLTKSIGIGVFVYILGYTILHYLLTKSKVSFSKLNTFALIASFLVFTFLFFPALWIRPAYYLSEIFSEGARVGVRNGHEQIIFGETTQEAGFLFYFLVLGLKISPFVLLGFLAYFVRFKSKFSTIFSNFGRKITSLNWFLGVFYLGYFIVMLLPSKKIDRYMAVMYPFFAYFAYFGFEQLVQKFKKPALALASLAFAVFVMLPLVTFFPYYFTYYSPLFVNADIAHEVVAQKPFGIGMFDLKNLIVGQYGEVKLGFIDTKPMKAIYPSSKIFDIRINGTNDYDLLILGPNEEIPVDILNSKTVFTKDASLYINGLEYWRIYVKE